MTAYVALLRGVNVGGRSKLAMPKLKATFEGFGCESVRTYINSGNVIFRDRRKASTIAKLAEEALGVRVAVRSLAEMEKLCASIPEAWANDAEQKTDVAFFLDEPGAKAFNALRADLAPREPLVAIDVPVTVRNVNTVRKLTAMLHEL